MSLRIKQVGMSALAVEYCLESLWKKELDSINNSVSGLCTFLQLQVNVLVVMRDKLWHVGTCETESALLCGLRRNEEAGPW